MQFYEYVERSPVVDITSKFIDSKTRKFTRYPCHSYLRTQSEKWPDIGLQITFSVSNNEVGEMEVRLSQDEADELAINLLKKVRELRIYEAELARKREPK